MPARARPPRSSASRPGWRGTSTRAPWWPPPAGRASRGSASSSRIATGRRWRPSGGCWRSRPRARTGSRRWRPAGGTSPARARRRADGPGGSGLVALGGFAFARGGGATPAWSGFAPASLIVPEVSLARRSGETRLTVNVEVAPDDTVEDGLGGSRGGWPSCAWRRCPCLTRSRSAPTRSSARCRPPITRRRSRGRCNGSAKSSRRWCWPARSRCTRPSPTTRPLFSASCARRFRPRSSMPSAAGTPLSSAPRPELLIRREGQRASTVALAGSTRRSADPAVDDHLGEQLLRSDKDREENAIVARRIARTLQPFSVWVTAAPEPVVVRVANIQHLATPIRAQLTGSGRRRRARRASAPDSGGRRRAGVGARRDPGARGI